jgi:hypothetical protein
MGEAKGYEVFQGRRRQQGLENRSRAALALSLCERVIAPRRAASPDMNSQVCDHRRSRSGPWCDIMAEIGFSNGDSRHGVEQTQKGILETEWN